jgi:hypothetical protein
MDEYTWLAQRFGRGILLRVVPAQSLFDTFKLPDREKAGVPISFQVFGDCPSNQHLPTIVFDRWARQLQIFLKAFRIGDFEIKQNIASHVFFLPLYLSNGSCKS